MSSPKSKNISALHFCKSELYSVHLIPEEGRWPSSPRLGWDAVDADSVRYVSHLDEALSAYGEVVWSWRRDAGVKFVSKSSRATVANSPFTGESTI